MARARCTVDAASPSSTLQPHHRPRKERLPLDPVDQGHIDQESRSSLFSLKRGEFVRHSPTLNVKDKSYLSTSSNPGVTSTPAGIAETSRGVLSVRELPVDDGIDGLKAAI